MTSIQWCCCKMETFLQMLLPNPLRFATPTQMATVMVKPKVLLINKASENSQKLEL